MRANQPTLEGVVKLNSEEGDGAQKEGRDKGTIPREERERMISSES
jgi:hypothetical protein